MNKSISFKFNLLFILFLVLIVLYIPVFSNQAQVEIFNAGVNLGIAQTREQSFDRATVESFILRDLRQARDTITGAESLMSQFTSICETRRNQIVRIIQKINDYSRLTRKSNRNSRMIYIKNIFEMYRRALAITLDSSRGDSCRAQLNCDGQLALAGYKFGQAWNASLGQGNRVRSFQGGRLAEMRDAIRKGIWLSMDVPNQRITMTGINKLCCSFGAKEEWDQHVSGLTKNSPTQSFVNVYPRMEDTVRRANLVGTPCMSEGNLERGTVIHDCRLRVTGTNGSSASMTLRSNGTTEIWWDQNGRTMGGHGRWSLNNNNILSFWGTWSGRFSGPVYDNNGGFKVVGTWSNGTQETLSFTCIRIIPD